MSDLVEFQATERQMAEIEKTWNMYGPTCSAHLESSTIKGLFKLQMDRGLVYPLCQLILDDYGAAAVPPVR